MTRFQIAYRPLQSALDHLSTLHALIVDAEQNNESLYVCFLDYKKFYDKCSRPHMWKTFVEMGFKGKTTVALHSIFSETWNTIRMSPTIHLEAFKQTDGVWQGSSPSTLLASLVFEKFIQK